MGKFLVRITLITTGLYMLSSLILAHSIGVDIMDDWYVLFFEAVCVVYCYSEGKYHCKHMRHLSLAILLSDLITRTDNYFDYLSVNAHNIIPSCIMTFGFAYTCCSAIYHFYKVRKLKKLVNEHRQHISN